MQQPSRKRQDVGSIPTGGFDLGGRLIGRTADSESANRGSNPRLPVGFFRSVAQRQQHRSYKPEVVGSIPTAPIWGCSQTGKALVLQTRNCGFESRRLHFFRMWDSGRPPVLGTGSRWFNSSHPDFVRVAQRDQERWFTKPEVVGSNPTTGVYLVG